MSVYLGIGSAAHKMSKLYVGIDGKARQVRKMYIGVNGQARLVYQSGNPIGSLAVGSTVKLKVNGAVRDFIVVHQGLPGSMYDASCNGTWLLQRYVYDTVLYNNDFYENSNTHAYMNNTFFPQLEPDVQSIVKRVKIPFRDNTGAKGLDTRAFALAVVETRNRCNDTDSGTALAYFAAGNSAAATYENGSAGGWWTRTRFKNIFNNNSMYYVTSNGDVNNSAGTAAVRPCMIVQPETLVDENRYVIVA